MAMDERMLDMLSRIVEMLWYVTVPDRTLAEEPVTCITTRIENSAEGEIDIDNSDEGDESSTDEEVMSDGETVKVGDDEVDETEEDETDEAGEDGGISDVHEEISKYGVLWEEEQIMFDIVERHGDEIGNLARAYVNRSRSPSLAWAMLDMIAHPGSNKRKIAEKWGLTLSQINSAKSRLRASGFNELHQLLPFLPYNLGKAKRARKAFGYEDADESMDEVPITENSAAAAPPDTALTEKSDDHEEDPYVEAVKRLTEMSDVLKVLRKRMNAERQDSVDVEFGNMLTSLYWTHPEKRDEVRKALIQAPKQKLFDHLCSMLDLMVNANLVDEFWTVKTISLTFFVTEEVAKKIQQVRGKA